MSVDTDIMLKRLLEIYEAVLHEGNTLSTTRYEQLVVHDILANHSYGSRIGSRDGVPTSFELFQNASVSQPSVQQQMEIVSSSANDTWGGTGINRLKLEYFNNAWERKTEQIRLNGTTKVYTTNKDIFRIDYLTADRVGSANGAVGTITVKSIGAGSTFAQIEIGASLFERALKYVKAGYKCSITDFKTGCSTNGGVIFRFILTEVSDDGYTVALGHESIELADNAIQGSFSLPLTSKNSLTVLNPTGARVAIGLAIKARAVNQRATGSFRFIESPID